MGRLRHIACVLSLIALGLALLAPAVAPANAPDDMAVAHDCTAESPCPATMASACAACVIPSLMESTALLSAYPTASEPYPIPAGPDVAAAALSQEPPPPRV